jgi:hypothetical protein
MDLFDHLLRHEHEAARQRLLDAFDCSGPALEDVTFNVFGVTLDRERRLGRVFDVLYGDAAATVVTLGQLRARLGYRRHTPRSARSCR